VSRVLYVFGAAVQGFTRNPVMSLASTFTVTLMLLLFAFFLTTDRGLQAAVQVLESKVELALFIDDRAKVSEILALKSRIERDPAVYRVDYITKDQALKRLQEIADRRKDFVVADLSSNPLPASLEIKLSDAREARRLGDELRAEVGKGVVYDVIDNPQVVDQLLTITRVLSIGGIAVLSMMLFVALFVIVNTIRIAVHARRDEIEIMQLVGATDWFVSWPFIIEAMMVGTFGAVIALVVLALGSQPVTSALVGFLDILPVSLGANFVLELAVGVLGFALLVGGLGASLSVRAQLSQGAHA
jgi:cell division transport system permease protein